MAEYHFTCDRDPVTGEVSTRRTERILVSHIGPTGNHGVWVDINGAYANVINVAGDPAAVRVYWRR